MRILYTAVVLLAVAGLAAAQNATTNSTAATAVNAALAPQSTSADGKKYWKDPITAAKANNLTAFAQTVDAAGLTATLGVPDLVATVFAPSNAAFEELTSSSDPAVQAILADKEKLVQVLQYHVVPGATLSAARITQMIQAAPNGVQAYKTLQGDKVNATLDGTTVQVNDVPVTAADIQGGKTMIHVIDSVLVPPSLLEPAGAAGAGADATTVGVTSGAGAARGADATATTNVAVPATSPKPANGAAHVAAGVLLAVPAAIAALL